MLPSFFFHQFHQLTHNFSVPISGILYSTEEHTIYGYVTNTKVNFLIVTDTSNKLLRDNEIRAMFRKLHTAYTNVICNPFYVPGDDIKSKYFEQVARSVMVS